MFLTLQHGLYYISFSSPLLTSSPQAYLSERVSADLWHARLGHPSTTTTLHVFNSYNLPYTSTKLSSCHDCSVAKCHRLPFMLSTSSSSAPLELVHSDLWGPAAPLLSTNGFRYYVVFLDDLTRFTWLYFLTSKDEVTQVFTLKPKYKTYSTQQ